MPLLDELSREILVGMIWKLADLNPVRAGMVEDPKDYRFCGYAAALAGNALARQGLLSCKLGADWDANGCQFRAGWEGAWRLAENPSKNGDGVNG